MFKLLKQRSMDFEEVERWLHLISTQSCGCLQSAGPFLFLLFPPFSPPPHPATCLPHQHDTPASTTTIPQLPSPKTEIPSPFCTVTLKQQEAKVRACVDQLLGDGRGSSGRDRARVRGEGDDERLPTARPSRARIRLPSGAGGVIAGRKRETGKKKSSFETRKSALAPPRSQRASKARGCVLLLRVSCRRRVGIIDGSNENLKDNEDSSSEYGDGATEQSAAVHSARFCGVLRAGGGSVDPLPIAEKALPQVAKNRLVEFDSLQWGVLPGLVQRAILWDTGIVMTSSSEYVQILTVCGQTMADLMLDVAVVQDIVNNSSECVLSKCGGNAQFLETCPTDAVVSSVRCFVDKTTLGPVPSFSGVYWAADGGNEEAPAPILRDHTSLNTSANKLYAIHLVDKMFSGVKSCETEARMIIPCREGNQNDGRICTPSNGATLDAWLKYLSVPDQSTFTTTSSVLLIILFLLIVALCALLYYLVRYKVDFKSLDSYDNSHTSNLLSNENMLNGSTPMDVFARSGGRGSRGVDPTLSNDALCNKSAILRRFVSDPTIVTKRISVSQITFLRVLSKGGNGEVWLGQYESRYVALKCLLASKREDISSLERFSDELRLASVLEHPRIVAFCGVAWQSLLHLCAVTEYMERGDLETVLSHPTATSMVWGKEKLPMAMDIAEALVYLHSLEPVVIHRDLKSKNILLDRRLRAKLSDFGLSRETSVEDTMTNGVGTILWSAPEVLEGKRYDEKADIFSYGIVLSEIDTCMLPYGFNKERGGKNKMKSMQIVHLVAEGKLLPTFREDCPPEIVDLARDCLELNPEKRPTAMEVVFRLRSKVLPLLTNSAFDEEQRDR